MAPSSKSDGHDERKSRNDQFAKHAEKGMSSETFTEGTDPATNEHFHDQCFVMPTAKEMRCVCEVRDRFKTKYEQKEPSESGNHPGTILLTPGGLRKQLKVSLRSHNYRPTGQQSPEFRPRYKILTALFDSTAL
uniref:Uncharacterized protein n=1 Tax=Ascaris lumbricoides TaxID=6252 RepID=A0A0M3HWG1_ASCLU